VRHGPVYGKTVFKSTAGIDMNATSSPRIHAVVEIAIDEECNWIDLPLKPWPRYVRLWQETEPEGVALLLGTLSSYGRESTARSAEDLTKEFPTVLPGGFAVVDQARLIAPGCCCGLETWNEWLDVLATGRSPWMGHDPDPFVEILADNVNIWPDGGAGNRQQDAAPIVFSKVEFAAAVRAAALDLTKFEEPLFRWLGVHATRYKEAIANQFRESFIAGQTA
jgi:hypothetical protein